MNFFKPNMNYNMNFTPMGVINTPYNPIINYSQINGINNPSFFNSTLQAFASINIIYMWINKWANNANILFSSQNFKITKELYNLFYALYTRQNLDSSNFILNYFNKLKLLNLNPNENVDNPIAFLYYLIQLIHYENNYPLNPNQNWNSYNNLPLSKRINDIEVRNIFFSLLKQIDNSIISQNFYSIIKCETRCNRCSIQYSYGYKYMIKFYVDDYIKHRNTCTPWKTNYGLNLDECFECYTGGYPCICGMCKNNQAISYTSFINFPKVLILALIRKKHTYFGDIDFKYNLNVNGYTQKGTFQFPNYLLKAVVSMNKQGQFFADISMYNNWFRYFGNQVSQLSNQNINFILKTFEPQLLIYESC